MVLSSAVRLVQITQSQGTPSPPPLKNDGAGCRLRSAPFSQFSTEIWHYPVGIFQTVPLKHKDSMDWVEPLVFSWYCFLSPVTFLKYFFFSFNLKTILSFQLQSAWFFSSHQKVIPDIPTPNYPNVHQENGNKLGIFIHRKKKKKNRTATWINLDMTLC